MNVPGHLIYASVPFDESFAEKAGSGQKAFASSRVAFVGLARNCAAHLSKNLARLELLGASCHSWCLHVETNDNTDATDQVLIEFCSRWPNATFTSQRLGRQQFTSEFAGRRTVALAEYRQACQEWVSECAGDADYVVVIDFDSWGGWSHIGVMNGIGWIEAMPDAYGMASVSLIQHPQMIIGPDGQPHAGIGWVHYDAWALRLNSYWDDYTAGQGGWKHAWLPPVGSDPVRVCSAFGGMTIYRTAAYLQGTYRGETDCEHVAFHRSVADATRQSLYLNPSQRMVMHWMEPEHGGQHDTH